MLLFWIESKGEIKMLLIWFGNLVLWRIQCLLIDGEYAVAIVAGVQLAVKVLVICEEILVEELLSLIFCEFKLFFKGGIELLIVVIEGGYVLLA